MGDSGECKRKRAVSNTSITVRASFASNLSNFIRSLRLALHRSVYRLLLRVC